LAATFFFFLGAAFFFGAAFFATGFFFGATFFTAVFTGVFFVAVAFFGAAFVVFFGAGGRTAAAYARREEVRKVRCELASATRDTELGAARGRGRTVPKRARSRALTTENIQYRVFR
jgi:membrane protein implicated in regulation of membrane protease activity